MNILDYLFGFAVDGSMYESGTPYVLVFNGCKWIFVPYGTITGDQTLSFDCRTFELTISGLAGNTVDLSCLIPDCISVSAEIVAGEGGDFLVLNAGTDCETSVLLPSYPFPINPDLQDVCDEDNTTNTDIEITDLTKGVILKSTDGTRHRITLVDDGQSHYNLDISAAL